MNVWTVLLHVLHFVLPAVVVAALLAPCVLGRNAWRSPVRWRLLRQIWCWLAVAGVLALLVGLWWYGRDGRIGTYALMVVAMGSMAALWRARQPG